MSGKSHLSSIGPSSHRSPSSPLPADALEYFSETAARMGNSGASGMMIQSPDGRPAGIFFQPKPTSSLGTRTPGSIASIWANGEEMVGSAAGSNHNRWLGGNSGGGSSSSNTDGTSSERESPAFGSAAPQRIKPALKARTSDRKGAHEEKTGVEASHTTTTTSPTVGQGGEGGPSFAQAGSRQTFTSSAQMPSSSASRPSAQPQAGLLIGAGFTPSNKKGGGAKKMATSMEILPPIKVLIVEDNEINVKILSTFLKQRKIQFGVAKNGREAVDQWQTGGYHLILMDIQLPVMDGIEATKEIRRLERGATIGPTTPPAVGSASATPPLTSSKSSTGLLAPNTANENPQSAPMSPSTMLNSLKASVIIVALTASILNSDRVAALAAGCNDFLNKPVNLRWLERKVIEWGSMQYLIGFRDINDDLRRQRKHQTLTDREVSRSNGLVEQGFGSGPDRLAKEMAGRLHIGSRKAR